MADHDLPQPTVGDPPIDVKAALVEVGEILDLLSELQFETGRYIQVDGVPDRLRKSWGPISARIETLRGILRVSR
jgi:hypothetical protein